MGNNESASGVIGAAAGVAALAPLLLYPVLAYETESGLFKVCGMFNPDDETLPFDVCTNKMKAMCVTRCATNVPESELPDIRAFVEGAGAPFVKFSKFGKRYRRDIQADIEDVWTF